MEGSQVREFPRIDKRCVQYRELIERSERRGDICAVLLKPGEVVMAASELRSLARLIDLAQIASVLCQDTHQAMTELRCEMARFEARMEADDCGVRLQR